MISLTQLTFDEERRCSSVNNNQNEISRFIYEICYPHIWTAVSSYLAQHLSLLDLSYSRIKYPDSANIEDLLLEFTRNIHIKEDTLFFEAVISYTINLTEDSYRGTASCDINQWFSISCEAVVTDRLESFDISNVQKYVPGVRESTEGQALSRNIAKAVVNADTLSPDGIQSRLLELQKELIKKANNKQDYDAIADEIFRLRDQKEQSEVDSHHREETMNRIKELQDFIAGQETDITEFDETLVKRLIEKITVFADHFTVEFKSGITNDIEV